MILASWKGEFESWNVTEGCSGVIEFKTARFLWWGKVFFCNFLVRKAMTWRWKDEKVEGKEELKQKSF